VQPLPWRLLSCVSRGKTLKIASICSAAPQSGRSALIDQRGCRGLNLCGPMIGLKPLFWGWHSVLAYAFKRSSDRAGTRRRDAVPFVYRKRGAEAERGHTKKWTPGPICLVTRVPADKIRNFWGRRRPAQGNSQLSFSGSQNQPNTSVRDRSTPRRSNAPYFYIHGSPHKI
jgi:hypothetical protein